MLALFLIEAASEVRNLANMSVRKLDEETLNRLRDRAARHGVSMEEEVRQILKRAVAAPERLGDLAMQIFGSNHGVDLKLQTRKRHDPIEFSE